MGHHRLNVNDDDEYQRKKSKSFYIHIHNYIPIYTSSIRQLGITFSH